MKKLIIGNLGRIKKAIPKVEDKIKIRVSLNKNNVIIKGSEINEFLVEKILHAADFGFDIEDALLLKNPDFSLEFIDIKGHTHRKNLKEVRSRVIGTQGKAKNTIAELTGGVVVVQDNKVGIIVDSDHLEAACQALVSLIHGSKHGNVFSYLERRNAKLGRVDKGDLGLKEDILEG